MSKFAQGRGLDKLGLSNENVSFDLKQSPKQASQFKYNLQKNYYNNDLDGGNNGDGEADPMKFLEKTLSALVKIQARVRGMIARKRVQKILIEQRRRQGIEGLPHKPRFGREVSSSIQKHTSSNLVLRTYNSHRMGEPLRSASYNEDRKGPETSDQSTDGDLLLNVRVKNPVSESKDTLSYSHLERMSSRRVNLLTRDWRLYFQQKELD